MASLDPTLYTNSKLYDGLSLRARRGVCGFSVLMGSVFVLATAIYAGVRGAQVSSSAAATTMSSVVLPTMGLPALTVCPMHPQSNVHPTECVFEQGTTVLADCLSQVRTVTVIIEQVSYACVQYNNPSSAQPFQATNSASELGSRTLVDSSSVPVGEPLGAYALVHAQGVNPTLSFSNSFVADPGRVALVLLRNLTYVPSSGPSQVEFEITISAANTAANDSVTMNTVDIDLIYPELIAYYETEVPIYIRHNWLGEVGGLAALLYFLHATVMWPLLMIVYFGGGAASIQKGMAYQVDDN